jgi:IPT/TIG domain
MKEKTRYLSAAVCVGMTLLIAVAAGCGPGAPVIKSVKPNKGLIRTGFKISGTTFGEKQGKSTVTVGGKKSPVLDWSETSIQATVPIKLTAGKYPVVVTTESGPSNKVTYTVYATFTGSTPLPAMLEFLKNRKIDTEGMTFSVVATSKVNPAWKLDKGEKEGEPTYYFLFHETADGWTLIDFGTDLTAEQMKIDGAPSDLEPPE